MSTSTARCSVDVSVRAPTARPTDTGRSGAGAAGLLLRLSSVTVVIESTSRGARGGVTLAREPKDITLLEVVEAIDGPIQLNECVGSDGVCTFEEECPIKPVWCGAQEELVQRLKRTNFAQLLA